MGYLKIDKYGNKFWYNDDDQLHREDGLALESRYGTKEWWINGELHRENGPAIELCNGEKCWWYYNKCIGHSCRGYTQEDFERYLRSLKIKEYW